MGIKQLDGRLSCIAGMVPPSRTVVDVGTDHGLLIAHLVGTGAAQRGIATDINPGPLAKAATLLRHRGLTRQVDALLTDGLRGLPRGEIDTVIVAGMGGELILRILLDWPHHRTPGITYLLQPMTKASRLRAALWQAGFCLRVERCCAAGGRGYTVMMADWVGVPQLYLPWQPYVGKLMPRNLEDAAYLEDYRRHLLTVAAARDAANLDGKGGQALRLAAGHLAHQLLPYAPRLPGEGSTESPPNGG